MTQERQRALLREDNLPPPRLRAASRPPVGSKCCPTGQDADRLDRKVTPWSVDEARTFLETARPDRLHALWAVALAIGVRPWGLLGFGGSM